MQLGKPEDVKSRNIRKIMYIGKIKQMKAMETGQTKKRTRKRQSKRLWRFSKMENENKQLHLKSHSARPLEWSPGEAVVLGLKYLCIPAVSFLMMDNRERTKASTEAAFKGR